MFKRPKFIELQLFNRVLTVKTNDQTYLYRVSDKHHLTIYSLWIDDIDWFKQNAEIVATNTCILEIGRPYRAHQLSIDAFKSRQKLEAPMRFEPDEVIRIAINDDRLVGGLPTMHFFGLGANEKSYL